MPLFSENESARLERAATLLFEAKVKLPVLKMLTWDRALADRFFQSGETEPLAPVYARPTQRPARSGWRRRRA